VSRDPRQSLGELGEKLACAELTRLGHAILARRYRTPLGEIDIVAEHAGTLVFVEVKARSGVAFGGAAAAVGLQKQRRVTRMAEDYLTRRRMADRPCRFDVVAVDVAAGAPRVTVYARAFDRAASP
jgi:putative endonuclease